MSGVLVTEVLHSRSDQINDPLSEIPKAREIIGLLEKGTSEVICEEELPKDSNVLGDRFLLVIKNAETQDPVYKSSFVVQRHTDPEKQTGIRSSTTLLRYSFRVLIALATVSGFMIWSQDVSQAYLQSAEDPLRDVYDRVPDEFKFQFRQLLKILKPLCGPTDSGDYWHNTFSNHHANHRRHVIFTKHFSGKLAFITGSYIDDTLCAGNLSFEGETKLTEKYSSSPFDNMKPLSSRVSK